MIFCALFFINLKPLRINIFMIASTHDGRFHADEIFALAVLNLFYPDLEIVRSRDENVYKNADIIVDVGHVYDPDNLIFDHHQRSFTLKRGSGIPYASFGLVWKQYGELLCGSSTFMHNLQTTMDKEDCGLMAVASYRPNET